MIRLYGYYSVGGYRDMFLGEISPKATCTYYFPLLNIMRTHGSPEELEQVKELESLPQINIITRNALYGFPQECKLLFSHGGYNIVYRTLSDGCVCLALSGIEANDNVGRNAPFNLVFLADNEDDIELLDKAALWCMNNYFNLNKTFRSTIQYDESTNGYRCDLCKVFEWMEHVSDDTRILKHSNNRVHFAMISDTNEIDLFLKEQNVDKNLVDAFVNPHGATILGKLRIEHKPIEISEKEKDTENTTDSNNNPEDKRTDVNETKSETMKSETVSDNQTEDTESPILHTKYMPWIIAGVFSAGFILGYMVCKNC